MGQKQQIPTQVYVPPTEQQTRDCELLVSKHMRNGQLNLSSQQNIYNKIQLMVRNRLHGFKVLRLSNNMIGPQSCNLLSQLDFIPVQQLHLDHCGILGESFKQFTFAVDLSMLVGLYLNNNELGDEGAKLISRVRMTRLKTLDLSHNKIDDEGAFWLQKASFIELTTLILTGNLLTQEGAIWLSNAQWPSLAFVNLMDNQRIQNPNQVENLKFKTTVNKFRVSL